MTTSQSQASLSALLHLQGLPPLPKSLTATYDPQPSLGQKVLIPTPSYGHPAHAGFINPLMASSLSSNKNGTQGRPAPPLPPPRPNSRAKSSSSNTSIRASPDQSGNNISSLSGLAEAKRGSPLSVSSSPYPDSGVGRSSAESFSEPKAFVRVVKAPPEPSLGNPMLDAQLAQLKKDMQHVRQQDMALLGHLLQIHQGIQDLRNILVPPPTPAPSSFMPLSMFQSTPAYPSRNQQRKQSHPSTSSKLSMFHGANKFFSRRSSADKLMSESLKMQELGACGGLGIGGNYNQRIPRVDDESDSLSSLEFGDN